MPAVPVVSSHPIRWCAAALALALAGCAQTDQAARPDAAGQTASATPASADPKAPRQRNQTRFPTIMLSGEDSFGAYWSIGMKTTYHFNAQGQLDLRVQDSEPMIDHTSPEESDMQCRAWGGGYNQRTVWFPDTAVFVAGGRLAGAGDGAARGKALALRPLLPTAGDSATLTAAADDKGREVEYARVACVGQQRVTRGWRTDSFLKPGDTLRIQPARGKPITLRLPTDNLPYALLNYGPAGQAVPQPLAAVPLRIVLATVDVPRRRVVLQWQATAAQTPSIQDVAWSITVPAQEAKALPQQQQNFVRQLNQHLLACPAPATPVSNACATPDRALAPEVIKGLLAP